MQKPACFSRLQTLLSKYAPAAIALLTLPLWYPLGIGLLLGWASRPLARRMPALRRAAQPMAAALLCGAAAGVVLLLWREVSALGAALPDALGELQALTSRLTGLPEPLREVGTRGIAFLAGAGRSAAYWMAQLGGLKPDWITALTAVASALLLPADAHFPTKKLPRLAAAWGSVRNRLLQAAARLRENAAGLAACVFPAAIGGVFLGCPLLFGGLLTLLEAVRPFGAGWVLLPMAFGAAVLEETAACAGLVLLYFVLLLRRVILPLPRRGLQKPLPTLAAAYVGYRVLGPAGALAALPIAAAARWSRAS